MHARLLARGRVALRTPTSTARWATRPSRRRRSRTQLRAHWKGSLRLSSGLRSVHKSKNAAEQGVQTEAMSHPGRRIFAHSRRTFAPSHLRVTSRLPLAPSRRQDVTTSSSAASSSSGTGTAGPRTPPLLATTPVQLCGFASTEVCGTARSRSPRRGAMGRRLPLRPPSPNPRPQTSETNRETNTAWFTARLGIAVCFVRLFLFPSVSCWSTGAQW